MEHRRFIIIGVVAAALILVSSLLSVLGTQAGEGLPPYQDQDAGLAADELPDLIVTRTVALTVTATYLDYRFVIKNVGVITADLDGTDPGWGDDVYFGTALSNGTDFDTAEKHVSSFPITFYGITELGPGEEFTLTHYANPDGVYFFDYDYFIIKIDSSLVLTETLDTNNEDYVRLPDGPDLIVESIDVQNINSSWVVYQFVTKNEGDGIADMNGVYHQGYLSEDDNLGSGDHPVGGAVVTTPTELYPGDVFTTTWIGASGSNFLDYRYVFVDIDVSSVLTETNETNNLGMGEIPYFLYLPLTQR